MNRATLIIAASALCLLAPACDFGRAEAERARLEAELRAMEAMQIKAQMELQAAQVAKARADVTMLQAALDRFAINNGGQFPDDLAVLAVQDVDGATYIGATVLPLDPWNNAYAYEPPGPGHDRPVVTCFGADGVAGGDGAAADITTDDSTERGK